MVKFTNVATADKYECTLEENQSVIVLQAKPAYRGPVSDATPEACEQMIIEGVPFIKKKQAAE